MPRRSHLPRPFYDDFPSSEQPAAHALWQWHSALANPQPVGGDGTRSRMVAFFEEERERAAAGEPMRIVREAVWSAAYEACGAHDLDRDLLAVQVEAAQHLQGSTRFHTKSDLEAFVRSWAVPHARLLAGLAGVDQNWKLPRIDELARGFFYINRLVMLPQDLERGRLFIPIEDLRQSDVSIEQIRDGTVTENVRRLLWKQSIRARDALAQGQPLMKELRFRMRYALKRWWLAALELLNELERRDYDLFDEPLRLSTFRKLQVYLQTVFGRARTG